MRYIPSAVAATLLFFILPASAFECTNAGAGATAPDDNASINSTACGNGATANGPNSTVVGGDAIATGSDSTTLGYFANSSGTSSTALGSSAFSTGFISTAVGYFASSAGSVSTAVGGSSVSSGDASTAVGYVASSAGAESTAVGRSASSDGSLSTTVGSFAKSTGSDSVALGYAASSAGGSSVALGRSASSAGFNSTALGVSASAPNPNTMVLGSIPGINSGFSFVDVAIGTTAPQGPLHIFRNDATREMMILESNAGGGAQDRAMMFLANNGGIRFEFDNPALGTTWRFQAATGNQDRFEVTKVGTGEIEFAVDQFGNVEIQGTLTELSDRNAKQDIVMLQGVQVLNRLNEVPISEWSYADNPKSRHIGPMAQDFHAAFGLGANERHISARDMAGVSLAAVQALAERNDVLQAQNEAQQILNQAQIAQSKALAEAVTSLQVENAALVERLAMIESLVTDLLPRTANN